MNKSNAKKLKLLFTIKLDDGGIHFSLEDKLGKAVNFQLDKHDYEKLKLALDEYTISTNKPPTVKLDYSGIHFDFFLDSDIKWTNLIIYYL